MPDEPTVGELARLIQGMRQDNATQFRGIRDEIRQLVSVEYLALHEKLLSGRIDDVVKDVAKEESERKADTAAIRNFQRWATGAAIAAVAVIVTLVLGLRGGP